MWGSGRNRSQEWKKPQRCRPATRPTFSSLEVSVLSKLPNPSVVQLM